MSHSTRNWYFVPAHLRRDACDACDRPAGWLSRNTQRRERLCDTCHDALAPEHR